MVPREACTFNETFKMMQQFATADSLAIEGTTSAQSIESKNGTGLLESVNETFWHCDPPRGLLETLCSMPSDPAQDRPKWKQDGAGLKASQFV